MPCFPWNVGESYINQPNSPGCVLEIPQEKTNKQTLQRYFSYVHLEQMNKSFASFVMASIIDPFHVE